MLKGIDTKTLMIIVLTTLLLLVVWLQPNKKINYYKKEIKELHQKNKSLMNSYDSLSLINKKIDSDLNKLYLELKNKEVLINTYQAQITNLKNELNETNNRVNLLNSYGVATEFTNYLKTKSGKVIRK